MKQAVEAAGERLWNYKHPLKPWGDLADVYRDDLRIEASHAIAAAAPHLTAQARREGAAQALRDAAARYRVIQHHLTAEFTVDGWLDDRAASIEADDG